MAIPSATVKITRACKTTSKPRTFQRASPKLRFEFVPVEPETERKIAGNDKTAPIPIKALCVLEKFSFLVYHPTFLLRGTRLIMCQRLRQTGK